MFRLHSAAQKLCTHVLTCHKERDSSQGCYHLKQPMNNRISAFPKTWEVWPRAGLLRLSTVDVWGWLILCGGRPVHCMELSSIPGLHPVDASSTPTSYNQHCLPTLLSGLQSPQLRTLVLGDGQHGLAWRWAPGLSVSRRPKLALRSLQGWS